MQPEDAEFVRTLRERFEALERQVYMGGMPSEFGPEPENPWRDRYMRRERTD